MSRVLLQRPPHSVTAKKHAVVPARQTPVAIVRARSAGQPPSAVPATAATALNMDVLDVTRRKIQVAASATFMGLCVYMASYSAPMSVAAAEIPGDKALGEQVFNNNCAACHMGGRNTVINDHTLDQSAIEKFLDGGFTIDAITYQIENGKGAMPAWADRLSEEEIQGVAKYVYETAQNNAWDN